MTARRTASAIEATYPALRLPAPDGGGPAQPLWSQVKSALLAMIEGERMPENARLPSESELCERFGVSRTVVREAMNQLVFERVIYKLQGKGAFVAGRTDDQDFLGSNIGFSGELHFKHRSVSRRILRQAIEPASERAARLLRIAPGDPVVALDRVLSVDGTPRILVLTAIPARLVPGLDQVPMHNRSLYDTLSRQYGIAMRRAERWLAAETADPDTAAELQIPEGAPVIAIESIGHSAADEPVEYYTARYRTDSARLHFRVG